jgi:hypothetical protein
MPEVPKIHRGPQGVADTPIALVDESSVPYGVRQTENQPQVMLGNQDGVPLDTPTGESGDIALAVHVEHLHQTQWLHPTTRYTGVANTLNGAVSGGDRDVILNDATGFTAGVCISLSFGAVHTHMYRCIVSVSTNTLTLDGAIDFDLPDGSVVQIVDLNLAVADGSSTPVVFSATPAPGESIDIVRMIITMTHKSAGTDDSFGSLTALTYGLHIRKNNGDGTYETLAIWRNNEDIRSSMYDLSYSDKAGPSLHGTSTRWSIFTGTGSVINLKGDNNETLEAVVQDDLTASTGELSTLFVNWQGHIEV